MEADAAYAKLVAYAQQLLSPVRAHRHGRMVAADGVLPDVRQGL